MGKYICVFESDFGSIILTEEELKKQKKKVLIQLVLEMADQLKEMNDLREKNVQLSCDNMFLFSAAALGGKLNEH